MRPNHPIRSHPFALLVSLSLSLLLFPLAVRAGDIVVIGDSLSCGDFGADLGKLIASHLKATEKVTIYCEVGSAPENWVNRTPTQYKDPKTGKMANNPCNRRVWQGGSNQESKSLCGGDGSMPNLAFILPPKMQNVTRVIAALGANSMWDPNLQGSRASYEKFLSFIHTKRCDWIGPPHFIPSQAKDGFTVAGLTKQENNLGGVYDELGKITGDCGPASPTCNPKAKTCNLANSRPYTAFKPGYKTIDGVHRANPEAQEWVDGIAGYLAPQPAPGGVFVNAPIGGDSNASASLPPPSADEPK